MPAIVTNDYRVFNEENFKRTIEKVPVYIYIGKEDSFVDDTNPPMPLDTDLEKTELFSDILAVKKVRAFDVQTVIPRYNWNSGNVYDEYRNDANMIDSLHPETNNFRKFYVLTEDLNVYKCLSNNYRANSTIKPSGESINSFKTADGYVWKFLYKLKAVDTLNFLTEEWMPVYYLKENDGSTQWQVQQQAVDGAIENINVVNGGSGYDENNPPTVSITGDGTGAQATAVVNSTGNIEDIEITNIGEGYTQATVDLTNTSGGIGATFEVVYSPIGGHGNNPKKELGGFNAMIKVTVDGDEGGTFPSTDYRQIGLIKMPFDDNTGSKIYTDTVDTVTGQILGDVGDQLVGQTSGATGTIHSFDIDAKFLYIENVTGEFIQGEQAVGDSTYTIQINDIENNTFITLKNTVSGRNGLTLRKGEIIYHANRQPISRNQDQKEDFRFVISF